MHTSDGNLVPELEQPSPQSTFFVTTYTTFFMYSERRNRHSSYAFKMEESLVLQYVIGTGSAATAGRGIIHTYSPV